MRVHLLVVDRDDVLLAVGREGVALQLGRELGLAVGRRIEEALRHHHLVLAVQRDVAEAVGQLGELAALQHREAVADQHRARDVFDIDRHPLVLQHEGAAVPERHHDDLLAGEGLQRRVGVLDDDRVVLPDQLGQEGDRWIDVVLVAAERFVQHLQPGIADPAIGRDADAPLVFRVQQILVGGRLFRLLGVPHQPHDDQDEGREPILHRAARRLFRRVDDVLVIGDEAEVVALQTAAEGEEIRLGLQYRQGREGRAAATRHRLRGEHRVDRVFPGHLDAVLLLEFRRIDKGRAQPVTPGGTGRGQGEIFLGAGRAHQAQLGERDRGGAPAERGVELPPVHVACHRGLPAAGPIGHPRRVYPSKFHTAGSSLKAARSATPAPCRCARPAARAAGLP